MVDENWSPNIYRVKLPPGHLQRRTPGRRHCRLAHGTDRAPVQGTTSIPIHIHVAHDNFGVGEDFK